MALAHALLSLLARGEKHGYELRRDLEREYGPDWRIDFGQLYRELVRMEREGWVKVRSEIKRRSLNPSSTFIGHHHGRGRNIRPARTRPSR